MTPQANEILSVVELGGFACAITRRQNKITIVRKGTGASETFEIWRGHERFSLVQRVRFTADGRPYAQDLQSARLIRDGLDRSTVARKLSQWGAEIVRRPNRRPRRPRRTRRPRLEDLL